MKKEGIWTRRNGTFKAIAIFTIWAFGLMVISIIFLGEEDVLMGPRDDYLSFYLDVGVTGDDDAGGDIFLDLVGVSSRDFSEGLISNGKTYRTLGEKGLLSFKVNTSSLDFLAENGVPYRDAILEIGYKDVINETDCYHVTATMASCRPRVSTLLNYGNLVYQSLNGIGGSDDDGWKVSKQFIEGNDWQTLRSIDGYFQFRIYYPEQLSGGDPLPIEYIRLRLVNKSEFEDLREQDRSERSFVRRDYVENNTIDSENYDDDYVVYERNYLEKIYLNTIPSVGEILSSGAKIESFEISGHKEPISFGIYAFEDLNNVRVEIGDLVSGGSKISKEDIKIEKVVNIDKRWGVGTDKYYGLQPWYLDSFDSLNISGGNSQQIWITIDVGDDIASGVYDGSVIVSGEGISDFKFGVSLEVFNLDLEKADATPYLYHSPLAKNRYYSDPQEVAAEDVAEHLINPLISVIPIIDFEDLSVSFGDLDYQLGEYANLGISEGKVYVTASDNFKDLWWNRCGNRNYFVDDCSDFDAAYVEVLNKYDDFFKGYGLEMIIGFNDEPGSNVEKRREANHLNKLAKKIELETWVTYYPRCEDPLAGYNLSFNLDVSRASKNISSWVYDDSSIVGLWDFENDFLDKSGNGNDADGFGGISISGGELVLDGVDDYLEIVDSEELDGMDESAIALWIKLEGTGSEKAWYRILSKGNLWGPYSFYMNYPTGYMKFFMRNVTGKWEPLKYNYLSVNSWNHFVVSYDGDICNYYLNGMHGGSDDCADGGIQDTVGSLIIGQEYWDGDYNYYNYFKGRLDDIMIFNRTLSGEEATNIFSEGSGADIGSEFLNLVLTADRSLIPDNIKFSFDNKMIYLDYVGVGKLLVNGENVFELPSMDSDPRVFDVAISSYLIDGKNEIRFEFVASSAKENFMLYFLDDFWRNAEWNVEDGGVYWDYNYIEDVTGDLGPMDEFLDERVYPLSKFNEKEIEKTRAAGDVFSFYTTYPANQPVVVNNRFLNGVYASALDAEGVFVYAYADWGVQPYDDMDSSFSYRIGTELGLRAQMRYELILPSWEGRVYDTIVYESLREGIEDSMIIATLKKAINENPRDKANEAQKYLDSLFERPSADYHNDYRYYDDIEHIEDYADRSDNMLFDLTGDSENYEFFDDMRRTMVDYIVALNSAAIIDDGDKRSTGGSPGGITPFSTNGKNEDSLDETNETNGSEEINNQTISSEEEVPFVIEDSLFAKIIRTSLVAIVMILVIVIVIFIVLVTKSRKREKNAVKKIYLEKARDRVVQFRETGHSDEDVKSRFMKHGWSEKVVGDILRKLDGEELR